jgi:hypothetical protein
MNEQTEFQWKDGDTEAVTVIGMSYQYPIDSAGRALVFQTHVPSNATEKHINVMLDKMLNAGERQRARVRIPEIELDIKAKEDFMTRAQGEMLRLDTEMMLAEQQAESQWRASGRKGALRLGTAQANDRAKNQRDREQAEANLAMAAEQLADKKNELTRLRTLLEG